jgi:hypothetical protein
MVEVKLELSEFQIQMLIHCIEGALDTKHVPEEEEVLVKEIIEQLSSYL